jgi:chromosome segregation ATPase
VLLQIDETRDYSTGAGWMAIASSVRKDQPLLCVTQRETSTEIAQTEALLAELRANRDRSLGLMRHSLAADLKSIAEERDRLTKSTAALNNHIQFLQDRVRALREATDRGLITGEQLQQRSQELETARSSVVANQAAAAQLDGRVASSRNQTTRASSPWARRSTAPSASWR